jgi:HD-GYP domain-containing protein (c-di-GMP phosphodiesterase class II)
MRARAGARAFAASTIALGTGAVTYALFAAHAPLTTLALLGAAVVVTELLQVPTDDDSIDPIDEHGCSFSSAVHIAAVAILGVWPAVLVAAFGVVVVDPLRRTPLRNVAFNASVFGLATLAGGGFFVLLGGTSGRLDLPAEIPAIVALALVYSVLNTVLINAIVALWSGRPLRGNVRDLFRAEVSFRVAEAAAGATLAFFVLSSPWKLVFLAPLFFAIYQAQARLALLRRETGRALETFANVVDERDPNTYRHSARVGRYVRHLARALDLPTRDVVRLGWAGRLHDLGKIAVDASVLQKPGGLDDDEWAAMKRHPRLSARLLRRYQLATAESRAVEYHHERFDGRGYYGVPADEQPLAAYFLAVADSYDAMTADRPYRQALPQAEALAEIEQGAGSQFHPLVAKAFVALQRGEDVRTTLTPEEWIELRQLAARSARRGLPSTAKLPEAATLAGVVGALLAFWLGTPAIALALASVAAIGLAGIQIQRLRGRRLAASLRDIVDASESRDSVFAAIVGRVAAVADLRWVAFVAWQEHELTGNVELERQLGSRGPEKAGLTSWLIRDAEADEEVLHGKGWELGAQGTYLAVPLRDDERLAGFLVFELGRGVPQPLDVALRATTDEIAAGLVPAAQPTASLHERRLAVAR